MEVPRLGVETELQLPDYFTATATQDPSLVCDHSSQKHRIPDPLSKVKDQTHILMDISQNCFHCTMTGTPSNFLKEKNTALNFFIIMATPVAHGRSGARG